MNKPKINLQFLFLVLIIAGGLFYWYEYRPTKIRQECSWIHKYSNSIPARAGKSQEEIQNCEKDGGTLCYLFSDPIPAQPAKDWWEKASPKEYNFCIHEKGLK
jgi:hypothetical protein